jgi:4-amino-4-deoxy-L-arabinose transferase-like glycosyltransferase
LSTVTLPPPAPLLGDPLTDEARARSRVARLLRGRVDDPAWVRPALIALLAVTAVLYLWGLAASGWANAFYSAAVEAGTKSWKAFFFGSFDSGNAITVDKPPASLWVMSLSARIFGVNAWSILVPEALMGVATVGVVYATVRRWFSAGAGLLAGAVVATTPVAVLMFRFNNPDALLVLLLSLAAYAVTRAVEKAGWRWLALAGMLVGFGFLTKMLQAFIVLPAFGLAYLLAAPTTLWRRLKHVIGLGLVALAASAWWVAIVELWPASSRPYIGGSQNNSVLDLIFGYNGFGRLTGNESGSVGGGANPGGNWGPTGWLRMFNPAFGGQISWLMPAALLLLAAGLVFTVRRSRSDRTRAALVLWGGWLVITAVVFSLGQGIIHEYYTVALAPAIGAIVGIGVALFWAHRHSLWARLVLAGALAVTVWWALHLLQRTPGWNEWLQPLIFITGVGAVVMLVLLPLLTRWFVVVAAGAALLTAFAGPFAYSVATAATPHAGAIPTAGPTVLVARGRPGFGAFPIGGRGAGPAARPAGNGANGAAGGNGGNAVAPPTRGGFSPPAGGNVNGGFGAPGGIFGGARGGISSLGGLLNASAPSAPLVAALRQNASQYRWVAATVGANEAAGYQLATGDAVMAIGGFNGTDPSPTLAQFQNWAEAGEIHYFIPGGGFGGSAGGQISNWVRQNFQSVTIGGVTMYDLTAPA